MHDELGPIDISALNWSDIGGYNGLRSLIGF